MKSLKKIFGYLVLVDGSVFLITLIASFATKSNYIGQLFAHINSISLILLAVILYIFIVLIDFKSNNITWTKVMFYISATFTFAIFIILRYGGSYGGGLFFIIPFSVAVISLLTITIWTIMKRKGIKKVKLELLYFLILTIITMLVINFF